MFVCRPPNDRPAYVTGFPHQVVYASYDRLMDPLPPPPEGLRWAKVRVEDAADGATTRWELVPKAAGALGADDDDVQEQAPLDSDYVEVCGVWWWFDGCIVLWV